MFSATTKEAANATASEAKSTVYSAKRDLRGLSEEGKSELTRLAAKAGQQVRGLVDSASDQLSEASEKIVGEIRNNPVRSSLIALGAGLVLGALLRR